MKKALFAIAVLAVVAGAAQAGEIKSHAWPVTYVAQELATFKVLMDIGYWVKITDQGKTIKISQTAINEYTGCNDTIEIKTNTALDLSVSIKSTGKVGGDFTASVDPQKVDKGTHKLKICATLKKADLSPTDGGSKNVHVADVTLSVKPNALPGGGMWSP
jgi:hypothetical protein